MLPAALTRCSLRPAAWWPSSLPEGASLIGPFSREVLGPGIGFSGDLVAKLLEQARKAGSLIPPAG